MKQPKKPTFMQKRLIAKNELNPIEWMVISEDKNYLNIVNKNTNEKRSLAI